MGNMYRNYYSEAFKSRSKRVRTYLREIRGVPRILDYRRRQVKQLPLPEDIQNKIFEYL